ncbi:MAG: acyltransferase, partial [Pseudomonadota bacterium]
MRTLGTILDENGGFGPGFDFARIALAMGILAFHSTVVTGDVQLVFKSAFWILAYALVPMFFALSGFLITGSGLRLTLGQFLLNRGLRIIPALAVEITISAIIIGLLFTQLSYFDYFTDYDFFEYFLNIVGYIQYDLPGVFLDLESAGIVNQSLWTVPYEILCYIAMSFIIILGLLNKPRVLLALTAVFVCLPIIVDAFSLREEIGRLGVSLLFGRGSSSFQCFLAGSLVYLYRHQIPANPVIFGGAVAALVAVGFFGELEWRQTGELNLVLCPLMTYVIIYVGLSKIPAVPLYSRGDYSY